MKIRGSFVTNSSSSNFVIFGNSRKSIIEMIKSHSMFGNINDSILRQIRKDTPISGDELKKLYKDEILYKMQYARDRTLKALSTNDPYKWMYKTTDSSISREAGLISSPYLDKSVAFMITLEDLYGEEQFGWKATGFHHNPGDEDDMVLVIGISHH